MKKEEIHVGTGTVSAQKKENVKYAYVEACIVRPQNKSQKGITLIALIITIIVMLILAGIALNLTIGERGIFKTAKTAQEEHIKSQLKDELNLAIMEIQMEEISKGNKVTLESLVEGQLQSKLEEITAELLENEINGEYKGYYYKIDEKLNVTIEDAIKGIRFSYKLEPHGYTNGEIKLTIKASSTNGEITNIQVPENLSTNDDGTYTITKNGSYEFIITDSTGENLTKILNINKIDKLAPLDFTPTIENITKEGFTIVAKTKDSEADSENVESGIEKYEYYINDELKGTSTNNKFVVTDLNSGEIYSVYVVAYDKAKNSRKSQKVSGETREDEVDYEKYIDSHIDADKKIYISSKFGNDTTGNGTKNSPYATLDKIAESGIIENGYTYAVVLMNGEYLLTEKIFELNNNQSINIFGNKSKTILNVKKIFGTSSASGKVDYNVNFYRLIWNIKQGGTNVIAVSTPMNFNNVYFKTDITKFGYAYFMTGKNQGQNTKTFLNCTLPVNTTSFLRADTGTLQLTNCYGGFSSGYGTTDDMWNYRTNYITATPKVDMTTYRITDNESKWKNVGTGKDPDGSQADLGVYGGEYSWYN